MPAIRNGETNFNNKISRKKLIIGKLKKWKTILSLGSSKEFIPKYAQVIVKHGNGCVII